MNMTSTIHLKESATGAPTSIRRVWIGRGMSIVAILFLFMDGAMKLVKPAVVVEGTVSLGYPESVIVPLGLVLLACVALYAIPATSILGAIFLTGYLGGAIATHVRIGNPLFSHTLFPIYVALLIWGGLFFRDERVRALIPLRR